MREGIQHRRAMMRVRVPDPHRAVVGTRHEPRVLRRTTTEHWIVLRPGQVVDFRVVLPHLGPELDVAHVMG